jgi:hypothetical protein
VSIAAQGLCCFAGNVLLINGYLVPNFKHPAAIGYAPMKLWLTQGLMFSTTCPALPSS